MPEKRRERHGSSPWAKGPRQAPIDADAQEPAPAKAGGAPWLKTTLVQCAAAAARKKVSYLQAQFHRLRARRGAKKALGALAASILTSVYHMLISGEPYRDLGPHHFDQRAKAVNTRRLAMRLQNLGYAVQITPLAA